MMLRQIGLFFLLVGLFILLIFIGTARVNSPAYNYCLGGLALAGVGIYLFRRSVKPPPPSGRFRLLNRKQKKK